MHSRIRTVYFTIFPGHEACVQRAVPAYPPDTGQTAGLKLGWLHTESSQVIIKSDKVLGLTRYTTARYVVPLPHT